MWDLGGEMVCGVCLCRELFESLNLFEVQAGVWGRHRPRGFLNLMHVEPERFITAFLRQ